MLVRHYSQDAARMCHVYVMGNGIAIQSTVRREVLPIYTNPFSSAETFFLWDSSLGRLSLDKRRRVRKHQHRFVLKFLTPLPGCVGSQMRAHYLGARGRRVGSPSSVRPCLK